MFSVDYRNKSMVINNNNIRRISFQNIDKIRQLVIQGFKNPCEKITLNLLGVKFIDSASFAQFDELIAISERHNILFSFANVDAEVQELFELIPTAVNYNVNELAVAMNTYQPAELV